MKKIIIIVLCLTSVLFAGCSDVQKNADNDKNVSEDNEINNNEDITFSTGIYPDKDWDEESWGVYEGDVIPNKDVAIKIANAIFDELYKDSSIQNYVPQTVFFDEEDDFWLISFWEEEREEFVLGGCVSIAIQKKDGKVLRVWMSD